MAVGIEDRNLQLSQLNEEIQQVKNELDERSSNMSDGSKFFFQFNFKKLLIHIFLQHLWSI